MVYGLSPSSIKRAERGKLRHLLHLGLRETETAAGRDTLPPSDHTPTKADLFVRRTLVDHRTDRGDDRLVGISDHREHDPVMNRIHLEHLEVHRLTFLHGIARILQVRHTE